MMGQQPRTESLFYYFRLEDQIPDDHLLKRLDRFIDFGFARERLRDTYSAIRPSLPHATDRALAQFRHTYEAMLFAVGAVKIEWARDCVRTALEPK